MPTVSRFFGITIRLYYDEHGPPHFHAYYGSSGVSVEIGTLTVMQGSLPRRAMALVLEWAVEHREELMADWLLAEDHQPLNTIAPLE